MDSSWHGVWLLLALACCSCSQFPQSAQATQYTRVDLLRREELLNSTIQLVATLKAPYPYPPVTAYVAAGAPDKAVSLTASSNDLKTFWSVSPVFFRLSYALYNDDTGTFITLDTETLEAVAKTAISYEAAWAFWEINSSRTYKIASAILPDYFLSFNGSPHTLDESPIFSVISFPRVDEPVLQMPKF